MGRRIQNLEQRRHEIFVFLTKNILLNLQHCLFLCDVLAVKSLDDLQELLKLLSRDSALHDLKELPTIHNSRSRWSFGFRDRRPGVTIQLDVRLELLLWRTFNGDTVSLDLCWGILPMVNDFGFESCGILEAWNLGLVIILSKLLVWNCRAAVLGKLFEVNWLGVLIILCFGRFWSTCRLGLFLFIQTLSDVPSRVGSIHNVRTVLLILDCCKSLNRGCRSLLKLFSLRLVKLSTNIERSQQLFVLFIEFTVDPCCLSCNSLLFFWMCSYRFSLSHFSRRLMHDLGRNRTWLVLSLGQTPAVDVNLRWRSLCHELRRLVALHRYIDCTEYIVSYSF